MKHGKHSQARRTARPTLPPRGHAKWAWHLRTLLALRARLLQTRGGKLADAAHALEPHSMDMADSATDEFDHDLVLSELSSGQDVLLEIEEALARIRNGTYGLCAETGKPIAVARLRAIPWTRFSLAAARRLEQRGALNHARLGTVASVQASANTDLVETEDAEPDAAPVESEGDAQADIESPGMRKPRRRPLS